MADVQTMDKMTEKLGEEGLDFERGTGGFRIVCSEMSSPAGVLLVHGECGWQLMVGDFLVIPEEALNDVLFICNEMNRSYYRIKFYLDEERYLVVVYDDEIDVECGKTSVKEAVEMATSAADDIWDSLFGQKR